MALEERQKLFVILTLILTLVGLGLMVGSFATDNWIKATGHKTNFTVSANSTNTPSMNASLGLFRGRRTINYGNGERPHKLKVVCDSKYCLIYFYANTEEEDKGRDKLKKVVANFNNQTSDEMYNYGLFPFSYWVLVILMSALGMIWGLVFIGFAIFNICGKPIETVTGPLGLYLWKGLTLFFSLLGMVFYLVLFFLYYKKSVLMQDDRVLNFVSEAEMDFSFYMLMSAVILFLVNMGFLFLSGIKFSCGFTREAEKVMDNGIILYYFSTGKVSYYLLRF
ncbi:uncharacterized protein LOC111136429 isoform X1 [Crassostrea virginica]